MNMRYFVGFLMTLGLIILLIILLFGGGGKPKVPTTNKTLDSYAATNAEVSMLTDGPTNANSLHQQIRITVSRDNVLYEELQGYDGNVTETKLFPNTQNAYDAFLSGLDKYGFTHGNLDKALADEKGHCAAGSRYIFELRQNERSLSRFWATSCGDPKTYLGKLAPTRNLFEAQVPGYNDLRENIDF